MKAGRAESAQIAISVFGTNDRGPYSFVIPMLWTRKTIQLHTRLTEAAPWMAIDIGPLPTVIAVRAQKRGGEPDEIWRDGRFGDEKEVGSRERVNPCGARRTTSAPDTDDLICETSD